MGAGVGPTFYGGMLSIGRGGALAAPRATEEEGKDEPASPSSEQEGCQGAGGAQGGSSSSSQLPRSAPARQADSPGTGSAMPSRSPVMVLASATSGGPTPLSASRCVRPETGPELGSALPMPAIALLHLLPRCLCQRSEMRRKMVAGLQISSALPCMLQQA